MNHLISTSEPLPTGNDPGFKLLTDDFERISFAGDEQIHLQVTLMRETWETIRPVIKENGWKINDGLIILLTTGVAYLRAERALQVAQGIDDLPKEDVRKLLERLAVIEVRYASIKNFAFSIMRDHRTLGMRFTPLEIEHRAFKNMLWPLREENEALKKRSNPAESRADSPDPRFSTSPVQPPHVPWWRRVFNRLSGCQ